MTEHVPYRQETWTHPYTGIELPAHRHALSLGTFGIRTVANANCVAMYTIAADTLSDPTATHSTILAANREIVEERIQDLPRNKELDEDHLDEIRGTIYDFDAKQQRQLDNHFAASAPEFFASIKERSRPMDTWGEWLSRSATNDQLLNFLQWHVDVVERQQSNPVLQRAIQHSHEQFEQRARQGVEEKWLSKRVFESLETKKVPIYIGSIFDTEMKSMDGYYRSFNNSDGHIVLSPIFTLSDGRPSFPAQLHEENHGIIQVLPDNTKGQPTEGLEYSWIMEALTEHSTNSMRRGKPDIVSDLRDGSYHHYLQLLTFVLRYGQEPIDPRIGTVAYSGYEHERRQLYDRVDTSWDTPNALGKIGIFCSQREQYYKNTGTHWMQAGKRAAWETIRTLYTNPTIILGEHCTVPPLIPREDYDPSLLFNDIDSRHTIHDAIKKE